MQVSITESETFLPTQHNTTASSVSCSNAQRPWYAQHSNLICTLLDSICNIVQVPFCYNRAREHFSILSINIKSCSVSRVDEAVSLANLKYCTQSV